MGWGVGGIEAEAVMLGQPYFMQLPDVVGMRLSGQLPEGATATDLVLTVTQMLRKKGVVDKFVEFYGPGLSALALADRATIANMAPEYGATMGFFPGDQETLEYLARTGRAAELIARVERYCKEQHLFAARAAPEPRYTHVLDLDLGTIEPSLAGPRRPQDRVPLSEVKGSFRQALPDLIPTGPRAVSERNATRWAGEGGQTPGATALAAPRGTAAGVEYEGSRFDLADGSVGVAAVTRCANTSHPPA